MNQGLLHDVRAAKMNILSGRVLVVWRGSQLGNLESAINKRTGVDIYLSFGGARAGLTISLVILGAYCLMDLGSEWPGVGVLSQVSHIL